MTALSHGRPGRPASETIRSRRREEILEAAIRLFAERGYSGANTQALADMLAVGKGTIYRYYSTKRELFLAAVDRVMRKLNEAIEAAVSSASDPLERMAQVVRAYLSYFAEHPEYVELLIMERAEFKDRPKPTYFVNRDANKERWLEKLRRTMAEGRLRQVPLERITNVVGDLLYGTMFTNYFTRRFHCVEEQTRDILDITFFGILSESERKRLAGQEKEGNQ